MSRRIRYLATCFVLVVITFVAGHYMFSSNLLVSIGTATFWAGERQDMNQLDITAPYGWYCITYVKTRTVPNSAVLHVAGRGITDCPLFGKYTIWSNGYPDSGTTQIPLDQPTMIYQNADKTSEVYVLITRDSSEFYELEGQ